MTDPSSLETIFFTALQTPCEAERRAYLDEACAGDSDLRARVEKMLAARADAGSFLERPAMMSGGNPLQAPAVSEGPGSVIGPYKLLQQIGEGGMGVVFMAAQSEPIQRTVAIKIIKPGMDTRQVIARFEAERQALAMMDHPNIAKVLDAGTTSSGLPYFVMELVRGVPITTYCDDHRLPLRRRLELLLPICHAVQHAHQKGLIHRDIKPTNVLVAEHDDRAVPMLIDFGVAKATGQRMTERTMFTEFGQMVGTLEYMSPEQARLNQLDIDTRSDIYSLGVLFYELLTGSTPFDRKRLQSAAFEEMLRIVREEEPPKPSTRLSNAAALPSVAANRSLEPPALNRLVRGELDWVVMKCLEKDRARRYESAAALATDVSHYLSGLPVSAGAQSRLYRIRKFGRRHRAEVLVSVGFAVLVSTTAVLATMGLIEQRRLRRDADRQRALAERSAADAIEQREISDAVSNFQTDMLARADPERGKGDKVTVLEAITAAVVELDKSTTIPPLVESNVRAIISATLAQLGRADLAEPNARRALELRQALLPPGDAAIRKSLSEHAAVMLDLGRLDEAGRLFEQVVASDEADEPLERVRHRHNLAVIYRNQGRYDQAEALGREVIADWRRLGGDHPHEVRAALANLSFVLHYKHRLDEAETLAREALAVTRKAFAPDHAGIAEGINNLASVLASQGKLAEVEPLFREAVEINRKALPAEHPNIVIGLSNLAAILNAMRKPGEAEPVSREALDLSRKVFGAEHPNVAEALSVRAAVLRELKRTPEAIALTEEALAIRRRSLPAGHPELASSLNELGTMKESSGDLESAERMYREALAIRRAALPADHPDLLRSISNLERCLADRARRPTTGPATAPSTAPALSP